MDFLGLRRECLAVYNFLLSLLLLRAVLPFREGPGAGHDRGPSHSKLPGRVTRGFQGVSLKIPRFPAHFFVNKFRKNRKNRFYGLPGSYL